MARLREPDLRMRLWEAELALLDGRQEEAGRILRVIREEAGEKRGEDPGRLQLFPVSADAAVRKLGDEGTSPEASV